MSEIEPSRRASRPIWILAALGAVEDGMESRVRRMRGSAISLVLRGMAASVANLQQGCRNEFIGFCESTPVV